MSCDQTHQSSFSLDQEPFLKVSSKSDEPNSRYIEKGIFWDQKWAILGHFTHFTPFCQMCDFREKLYNNNRHHFRPFSAKSWDSIFFKSPKTSFLGYLGTLGTWAIARFGAKP